MHMTTEVRSKRHPAEKQDRAPDLLVISPLKAWICAQCDGSGDLLFMENDAPLCLECADLDRLVFLPAGDAALTRRAKKESGLAAVVVRFSRSRRRYERRAFLSKKRHSPGPKLTAWLIKTRGRGAAFARPNSGRLRTTVSRSLWARRSFGYSRVVRRREPRTLPPMPELVGAGASAGVRRAGHSTPKP
jgi:hypothetical protein